MAVRSSSSQSAALIDFDSLPNSAYVREPVVRGLFSISHSTLWRRVADGHVPAPRKLSARVTAWNVGALRSFMAGL